MTPYGLGDLTSEKKVCLELVYPIPYPESRLTLTLTLTLKQETCKSLAIMSTQFTRLLNHHLLNHILKGHICLKQRKVYVWWGLVLSLLCLHLWFRWPVLSNPHFHNEDTAGITYSAELILRGGVPLRDTVEMKAPGSFFILAIWWYFFDHSMMNAQLLMMVWSGLAAVGVGVGAWWLTESRYIALLTALAYVVLAPYTDSIDLNYGAWMITPYIWSVTFLLYILKKQQRSLAWPWILAGSLMTIAALCKRQGVVIAPLFLCSAISLYSIAQFRLILRRLTLGILGSFLTFIPIMAWYDAHHALGAWIESYVLSRSGWEYVKGGGGGRLNFTELSLRMGDGILGIWEYSRAPICFALCATIFLYWTGRQSKDDHPFRSSLVFLWILTALSFVGASLGWRYFKGYYLQLLPGLLWIGSLALKYLNQLDFNKRSRSIFAVIICLLFIPLSRDLTQSLEARSKRAKALYLPTYEVQRVSSWIKKQAQPDDHLWVWGRWAWPLYHHTGLMSPTRYYKSLGVLTTQLTNTWNPNRQSAPVRFNPQSAWQEAIKELRANPPRFIVLARNEDWREFKALKNLLSEHYQRISSTELKLHRPRHEVFTVYQRH